MRYFFSSPTPTPISLLGDANGDGHVNTLDLSLLSSEWGQSGTGLQADLNHDGVVNVLDLSVLASNWLKF